MIFEAVVRLLTSLVVGLLDGIASVLPDPPGWVGQVASGMAAIASYGHAMSTWVPFSFVVGVAGTVIACMGVGLVIKLIRIVASFLTAGGGSAA